MYAPITGSVFSTTLPLQGVSQQIAFSLPAWFNTDPETGLLGKVLGILGEAADPGMDAASRLIESAVPGNGSLDVPRLAFLCDAPANFWGEESTSNGRYTEGYYRASSGAAWCPIYRAQSVADLLVSDGPVVLVDDSHALVRNIDRELIWATGASFVDDDGDIAYRYTLPKAVHPDIAVLTTVDLSIPSHRWTRHEPETIHSMGVVLSTSGTYLWYSPSTNRKDFDILWVSQAGSGQVTASPVELSNHWDRQASYAGLVRRNAEPNNSLRDRIRSVYRYDTGPHRQAVLFQLALSLGLVTFYEWDGVSPLTLGDDHTLVMVSQMRQTDWMTETLKSGEDAVGHYFTSSRRTLRFADYILDGRHTAPEELGDGVIRFNPEYGAVETPLVCEVASAFDNWVLESGVLHPTGNLPAGQYHVAVVKGIDAQSLSGVPLQTRLFDGVRPTPFARNLFAYQRKRSPVLYGTGRWGVTRFFSRDEKRPTPALSPYSFED